jgi:hypothetical protein
MQIMLNRETASYRNGGAVTLDSQGCKPLVGIPNMYRESRSDGIGSSGTSRGTHANHANSGNPTVNATAPPFPILWGIISRGLHPRLSNTIAPRFKTINGHPIVRR